MFENTKKKKKKKSHIKVKYVKNITLNKKQKISNGKNINVKDKSE